MEDFPPGFRFYPTEEELVSFYLHNKLQGNNQSLDRVIPVIDVYQLEPWELPKFSGELCRGDTEQWFFFVPMQEREARGGRPNRTTASGYWKATGSPNYVYSTSNKAIGLKKTMVYYNGKAPSGRKTTWKMNEYRAIQEPVLMASSSSSSPAPRLRHEMCVCRVYVVSGSFRAFDRRPLGTVIRAAADEQVHGSEPAENVPKIEKTSSAESSYSGEKDPNIDPVENEGVSDSEMMEPFWDLDQINWL